MTDPSQLSKPDTEIELPGVWSLRKLQLADRSEWALQYMGMDWIRMSEFLPSKDPTSMDEDVRKFAAAVNSVPAQGQLIKRPVAFRVPRVVDDKLSATEWRLFTDEGQAREAAEQVGAEYQGLYVRDGTPLTFPPQERPAREALRDIIAEHQKCFMPCACLRNTQRSDCAALADAILSAPMPWANSVATSGQGTYAASAGARGETPANHSQEEKGRGR